MKETERPFARASEGANGHTDVASTLAAAPQRRWWVWARRLALGLSGFLLFYVALGVMKSGSGALTPFIREELAVTNVADSLGLGWLMAYLAQSGSPVAAVAVAMLSADALTPSQAFTMIAGSRLGASLTVLHVGFLYALRGRDRWTPLTAGVLSLLLTGSALLVSMPVGLWLLDQGQLDRLDLSALTWLGDWFERGLDVLIEPLALVLPGWALFLLGAALVLLSFKLFDLALPQFSLEKTDFRQITRLVYRPTFMFLIGVALTFATMSVSVSVGLLVPLSVRGYMRRENIMAYILGANVSTFIDTLVAAVLLGDPRGVAVVLVHMLCAATLSLGIVLFAYGQYERAISAALDWITQRPRNFAVFLGLMLVTPVALILV